MKQAVPDGRGDIFSPSGFTLIELAMVLVVIGLLIGLGAGLIGPLIRTAKYNETKDIVNADAEAVFGYGAGNKRLPTIAEFPNAVRNPRDAFTKDIAYVVDADLKAIPAGSSDTICGRKTTNITLKICPDAACAAPTNTIPNIAFILVSGADNYNNQTGGSQEVSTATTISVYEVGVDNIDNYSGDFTRLEAYDDIVKWATLDELRTKTGCQGPQLRIIGNELPPAFRCSNYSAVLYADGGTSFADGGDADTQPDYSWCVTTSAPGGLGFNCNGGLAASVCGLSTGTWNQCTGLSLNGTPNVSGTFSLSVFVKDNNDPTGNNDNITQKNYVLTIGVGENRFRVWNDNTLNTQYDFVIDGGTCRNNVSDNPPGEITNPSSNQFFDPGESVDRYNQTGTCNTFIDSFTYSGAVTADQNCNFQVNIGDTGFTDK